MNERDIERLDLKAAFPPTPDVCRNALLAAARSVKEEQKMKRATLRTVVIIAAIILATMAIALAAEQFGLVDMFRAYGNRIALPQSAQDVLSQTKQQSVTLGNVRVVLQETLADGRLVYLAARAQAVEGVTALLFDRQDELTRPIPAQEAARLNVAEGLNYMEAAKAANVPLYAVSARFFMDEYRYGDEMMDSLFGPDSTLLLINMLQTNPADLPDVLRAPVWVKVFQVDVENGQYMEGAQWQEEIVLEIPVHGITATRSYLPEGGANLAGFTVQSVLAEQTCAGVYITETLLADEGTDEEAFQSMAEWFYLDAQGEAIPGGISLSGYRNDAQWPVVTRQIMLGVGELPDSLTLTDYEQTGTVTLKAQD